MVMLAQRLGAPAIVVVLLVGGTIDLGAARVMASSGPGNALRTVTEDQVWTERFPTQTCDFVSTGRNNYLVLEPGHRTVLAGEEDGKRIELTTTVLAETEPLAGVETRVVEERSTENGALTEVSRNYFAYCVQNGGVFVFGEDTDWYEDGQVVSHEGSWRAGQDNAAPGLLMPSLPLVGGRYYQEMAPDVAADRAEIVGMTGLAETPGGWFADCLVVEESNPLEPDSGTSTKMYAPGIGLVIDDTLSLVSYEPGTSG